MDPNQLRGLKCKVKILLKSRATINIQNKHFDTWPLPKFLFSVCLSVSFSLSHQDLDRGRTKYWCQLDLRIWLLQVEFQLPQLWFSILEQKDWSCGIRLWQVSLHCHTTEIYVCGPHFTKIKSTWSTRSFTRILNENHSNSYKIKLYQLQNPIKTSVITFPSLEASVIHRAPTTNPTLIFLIEISKGRLSKNLQLVMDLNIIICI